MNRNDAITSVAEESKNIGADHVGIDKKITIVYEKTRTTKQELQSGRITAGVATSLISMVQLSTR